MNTYFKWYAISLTGHRGSRQESSFNIMRYHSQGFNGLIWWTVNFTNMAKFMVSRSYLQATSPIVQIGTHIKDISNTY